MHIDRAFPGLSDISIAAQTGVRTTAATPPSELVCANSSDGSSLYGGGQGMSMVLVHSLNLRTTMLQEARLSDGFYDALDYWTTHPHNRITFKMDGEEHSVSFTSAPSDWIETIIPGERIGAVIGDMMFVCSSHFRDHPTWIPFVVAKLYGEKLIDEGKFPEVNVHWDALFKTVRLANSVLDEPELYDFLEHLKAHERTGYFEIDEEASRFLAAGKGALAAKRAYLKRHRKNRWVARGREVAVATELGDRHAVGFQNHAEMVARRLQDFNLFSAAYLVRMIREVPFSGEEVAFMIGPEFAPIAYELTREANRKVDLIRFVNDPSLPPGHNKIVRLKDKRRRVTWAALSKRLSYMAHSLELAAVAVANRHQKTIDAAIVDMASLNDAAAKQLASANAMITTDPQQAATALEAVQAVYPTAVDRLQMEQERAATNLQQMRDLAKQLRGII